jgi:hypothetical protein
LYDGDIITPQGLDTILSSSDINKSLFIYFFIQPEPGLVKMKIAEENGSFDGSTVTGRHPKFAICQERSKEE